MSQGPIFTTIDASKLQGDLLHLLCRTAREKGRIELTNCDGGACVLISKEELDCMEQALEILYNAGAGEMNKNIEECVVTCALAAE